MHYENRQMKKPARVRQSIPELKRHVLEAEDLAGLSLIEHFTPYSGVNNEQPFDAFIVSALSQVSRRVGELEKQLRALRRHSEASPSKETIMSGLSNK
jgi:hypothetical protein